VALGSTQPGVLSTVVNWVGNGVDQSPPSPAKVKNDWSCTSASAIHLHGLHVYSVPFFFICSSWPFEYLHKELQVLLVCCVSVATVEWQRHKNVFIYTFECNCINKMSYLYNYFSV